jgi:hypothetical protein
MMEAARSTGTIPPIPQVADLFFETPLGRWKLYRRYRRRLAADLAASAGRSVDIPFEVNLGTPDTPLSDYIGEQLQTKSVVIVSDAGGGKTALYEVTAFRAALGRLRFGGVRREPVILRGTDFNGDLVKAVAAELRF